MNKRELEKASLLLEERADRTEWMGAEHVPGGWVLTAHWRDGSGQKMFWTMEEVEEHLASHTMTKLFHEDGEPTYQPLSERGINYREPWSRTTRTGWFHDPGDGNDPVEVDREEVAELLGVTVEDVVKWENATDSACEAEQRAEGDGY